MNEQETLTSVAEFAIALAGFSGIVVALGKQPGRWAPADRYRLLNVLTFAFSAGFMAYLPMGLAHAGLSGSPLWRASSGFFLCFEVVGAAVMIRRTRSLPNDVGAVLHPVVRQISYATSAIAILALLLNTLGLGFRPQFSAYFLGLVILLLNGSIQFTRILFARPD